MKIYSTNRINALGLKGPEELPNEFPESEFIEVDNDNIQESEKKLYEKTKEIFSKHETQIFIGGDHSITYPLFKAFREENENPFLIVLDAHADCMPPQPEPTHEEFLRANIEEGLNPESVIQIGVRKVEPEEEKFLEENKIKYFKKVSEAKEVLKQIKGKQVYLSIDIDALDPKEAPAVNYPEPEGLTKKELIELIGEIKKINPPKNIDIVEAIPKKDDKENSTLNAIKEIIEKISD